MLSKTIFDVFIKRDTLLSPDAVKYIQDQTDPMTYVNNLVNNLEKFPLVLTLSDIKKIEDSDMFKSPAVPDISSSSGVIDEVIITKETETPAKIQKQVQAGLEKLSDEDNQEEPDIQSTQIPGSELLSGTSTAILSKGVGVVGTASEKMEDIPSETALKTEDIDNELTDSYKLVFDITGKSTCEGTIKDFGRNISNRYTTLKNIIRHQHRMFVRPLPIEKINLNYPREVHIIGMIVESNTTKKGNLIINLEDETGDVRVFMKMDEHNANLRLLEDEVIGIAGEINPELKMVMADRIVRPSPPRSRVVNRSPHDIDAVFIADIHVGSTQFLESKWKRFVKWLSGEYRLPNGASAEKVKYVIVAGDLVDGIGIYPDQEEELSIKDIHEQYSTLAGLLSDIPKDMQIILSPGNHDAVRQAEPQPALNSDFQKYFSSNMIFVGNPCLLTISGVEILIYHGRSFDDIVKFIPEATYSDPIKPMKDMLIRRHLVPIYGERTPIAPEHKDALVIDRLPDIFVTGHIHVAGCERFCDILLINASAWQAQTSYQKTLNFNPDPAKAYLVNLHSVRATELDFSNQNY